jgi:dynein heavy chain
LQFSLRQLDKMVELVGGDLGKLQRKLMGALLTIEVHARDVVISMVNKGTSSVNDFEWTKQLRYYWEEEIDDCVARQTNTRFRYGYEYLGNSPRLVITPLTDICYMTLTGALHLSLGGAPAGPAGTGKTETTKDLAKALAVQCVVFNCSDGLDYKIMGRFFSGLAQAGAWACFDEFNRIDIEVLSVIAQQILCIQHAVTSNLEEFEFEGKMIPLKKSFGVFITMNPGYAGRTELPDNLKALFRPVAMMVPDYRLIAEIVLFSEGFADALPLSNKMTQLYALSSEQLSKQDHYDFGMRAVKSVLVAAGQLKRKEPETREDLLLIRAMRDSNVPKFLEHDLPLFYGILSDLFPGIDVPYVDYGKLKVAIENQLSAACLQKEAAFVQKIIQVHETQLVRHGMMVVGEAGSGKTTNCEVLAKALTQLYRDGERDKDGFYRVVDRLILNPKSITAGQLYGEFNLMTHEWSDGLVPKLVRQCVTATENSPIDQEPNRKWIMFDGPVDAVWIENMNTVLDDNKTLCLANSERIKLPSTLHMMFETQDLKVASPATVSRCGMVYMEQIHVGILSLARSWKLQHLDALIPSHSKEALDLIETHFQPGLDFVREHCKEKIVSVDCNLMQSLLKLLTAMLGSIVKDGQTNTDVDMTTMVRMSFVFAYVWSLGANVEDSSRPVFNKFALKQVGTLAEGAGAIDDVFNYFVNTETGKWASWDTIMKSFEFDLKVPYFNILVPTQDTTRYRYLLDKLLCSSYNVLLMGETGVGKSVIIQSYLNDMSQTDRYVSFTMGYSAQTTPTNLKDIFETKLEKKRKNLLGPPAGKQMMLFIDDLNMPSLEVYGAQPPNELLRQVIDQGGFYDTQKMFFKNVKDIIFAAACAPPGGGRNEISPRLVRQFNMIWMPQLSETSMTRIFQNILEGFVSCTMKSLVSLVQPVVTSSVTIYRKVQEELLPTPSKSHYTFNLRDLSKVFQGLLMVSPSSDTSVDMFMKLWLHEVSRVFRDRLVGDEDRSWFNGTCKKMIHDHVNLDWEVAEFENLYFGDYMARENKAYTEVTDVENFHTLLVEYLEEYNISNTAQMHLVFFSDAISHISRICRVLRLPRGNALLVGVGGSGRQSLTRLASFMSDYTCFSIEITRGYGKSEWCDDLKSVLITAGAESKRTTFLFSDSQIVNEDFLEDINNILNTGEVPNLFGPDDLAKIETLVRPLAKAAGKLETRDEIMRHFLQLVRENLHIVLTFSPIGQSFRNRCRMFPSLVNCCTIDWFNAWPEDALFSVAKNFLDEAKGDLGIDAFVDPLCKMAVTIHRSVETATADFFSEYKRQSYTTPTSYLELIKLYVEMLRAQRTIVSGKEKRYTLGLNKLMETEHLVEGLQSQLTDLKPVLLQAQVDTDALLQQVAKDQKEADVQQQSVEKDVEAATIVENEVSTMATDCQRDLDEALPAYESAIKALDSLDKKSIVELKSFKSPPAAVGLTMNAVCLLFGVKQEWGEAKKLMGDMRFLDKLKEFDKDNIPPKIIKSLNKWMMNEEFTPQHIQSVSSACTSICMWVRAMYTYDKVAKNIAPKREKLQTAKASLKEVQDKLREKQSALQTVLETVASLKKKLSETEQKKQDLESQVGKTTAQLGRAEQLISSLGDEKGRWGESKTQLAKDLTNLVGNMILSAGCIAYLGPFTSEYRERMAAQWVSFCIDREIPVNEIFSLQGVLADPVVVREWQIMGLPGDAFSIENGMFSSMGRRWPLMIDPQAQANRWIKNTYKDKNLQIIKLSQKDFLRTLENAIRYGAPVLLENVQEELDPALEPVLMKQIFKKGGQRMIRLGDSDVPYSDEFKFFITTKLANPHYMPEICIKCTIINFTVTQKGLEDQLLVNVVQAETPELEEKKDKLVVNIAADKRALSEVEDKILKMLANSSGNILDDEELISWLAKSKVTSTAINVRMVEAEKTTAEINSTRELYRPVATRGSVIYFVIASLAMVDPMYQYSLQYYQSLYCQRLEKSEKSDALEKRLEILLSDITKNVYVNVCRGLFEKDKLLFSFMIATNIARTAGVVSTAELKTLMVGPGIGEDSPLPPQITWLTPKVWSDLCTLEKSSSTLAGICESIVKNESAWKRFATAEVPHLEVLPGIFEANLTNMQKLLVLRIFRTEKIVHGVREFVRKELGTEYTESPSFDLEGAFNDSTAETPLIFVLSPGADITDYLVQLGESKGKIVTEGSLKVISLGQGQGPIAEKLMLQARQNGDWVCLQNCHLAISWLPRLEQDLEHSMDMDIHPDFRLWLTSMPSNKFPVPILQNGIKITNEPPKGLKANLNRTFADLGEDQFEALTGTSKERAYKKLLFGLAFYNALILERRKFGAVGWNIPYGWMNSDLKTGIQQLKLYIEDQNEIPLETLNVIIADVTYGGRITDVWDKRTNSSLMRKFFCDEILDDAYRFDSKDRKEEQNPEDTEGYFCAPPTCSIAETRAFVSRFPISDPPETFGLVSA